MPQEQKNEKTLSARGGVPIFAGKTALIRFINNNDPTSATIWFADNSNKTIRPFVPESVFSQMFESPEEALRAVVTLPSDELGPEGMFKDFEVLGEEYGVQRDGKMKPVKFSRHQLQQRYGQPPNPEGEAKSMQMLDGLLSSLTKGSLPQPPESPMGPQMPGDPGMTPEMGLGGTSKKKVSDKESFYDGIGGYDGKGSYPGGYPKTTPLYGADPTKRQSGLEDYWNKSIRNILNTVKTSGKTEGLTPSYIDTIINNPSLMSYYAGALTYGGYQLSDIYADIYREATTGTKDDKYFISPTVKRNVFYSSPEGKKILAEVEKALSTQGMGDTSVLRHGMYDMSDELFKVLVPISSDVESPEFESEMEKINTAYYDALMAVANANTEVEHTEAKAELSRIKSEIEKQLGITLSDNSEEAWKQLEALSEGMNQRGIQGSGFHNEAVDDVLRRVRTVNERQRDQVLTQKEEQEKAYYKGFASPAEIAALSHDKKVKWGLVPPSGFVDQMKNDLKTRYPEMTDQEINDLVGIAVDENGNMRSNIYQQNYVNIYDRAEGIMAKKKEVQTAGVLKKEEEAQEEAFREFTIPTEDSGDIFTGSMQNGSDSNKDVLGSLGSTQSDEDKIKEEQLKQVEEAAKMISEISKQVDAITGGAIGTTGISSGIPAAGTQYSSLYDYLVKTTGMYNPIASSQGRQDLASKYGISNYTGSADQNTLLLERINNGYTPTTSNSAPKVNVPQTPISVPKPTATPIVTNTPPQLVQTTGTSFTPSTSGYSFNKTPMGNYEIFKDGGRISTTDLKGAKLYGYTGI